MSNAPVTCEVRYRLDPDRIEDFKAYAKIWIKLIERHGGTHHGYFIPRKRPTGIGISFPGVGEDGADDIAIALFTFPDDEAYLTYREKIANDPDGIEANARFGKQPPFLSYERAFLQPIPPRD
ncbi:NIPSNAP family protein [Rhizobium sp. A22-96]